MPFFSKLSASLYVDETVPRTPRTVTLIKCLIHCNDAETPNFCSRCIHPSIHDNLAVYVVGLGFIFRLPPVIVTFTNRRVYTMRL